MFDSSRTYKNLNEWGKMKKDEESLQKEKWSQGKRKNVETMWWELKVADCRKSAFEEWNRKNWFHEKEEDVKFSEKVAQKKR